MAPTPTSSSSRLKILFTSTHLTSFIQADIDILRKHFEVHHLTTNGVSSVPAIAARVLKADVTFTWFASVYSAFVVFFARILGRKSIIVVGGVDVAEYAEIGYGIWLSPWKSPFVKYAMRNADKVLPVDPFQAREARRLARYDGANLICVPTGYDPEIWSPSGTKENFVLTVAVCESEARLKVKGISSALAVAVRLPDLRFVIIGIAPALIERIRRKAPRNVELLPFLSRDELREYYRRARVYCQPSLVEGLPNSVCEAMLCECIPVGTNVGGMATAIGNSGIVVPPGDLDALAHGIDTALKLPESAARAARRHIAESFTIEKRELALVRIIQSTP